MFLRALHGEIGYLATQRENEAVVGVLSNQPLDRAALEIDARGLVLDEFGAGRGDKGREGEPDQCLPTGEHGPFVEPGLDRVVGCGVDQPKPVTRVGEARGKGAKTR